MIVKALEVHCETIRQQRRLKLAQELEEERQNESLENDEVKVDSKNVSAEAFEGGLIEDDFLADNSRRAHIKRHPPTSWTRGALSILPNGETQPKLDGLILEHGTKRRVHQFREFIA